MHNKNIIPHSISCWLVLLLFTGIQLCAQVEGNQSSKNINSSGLSKSGLDYQFGKIEDPKINNFTLEEDKKKESKYLKEPVRTYDMHLSDGLLKPDFDGTPKRFKKDKSKGAIRGNQDLGSFEVDSKIVQLVYRDHMAVDGDVIRIFINDDVIRGKVVLGGSYQGFAVYLADGLNKIEIQALNQGDSGPNTAQFKLYDQEGTLITSNIWNLLTGGTATLLITKTDEEKLILTK
ncbi:hypothetical protein NBT05_12775 [Aquimarina sp. ERC-38]|uniref:hypothetical protein n=1 Tax=Aquimarina sp. ERC-38 TaxID=2949996 RepID=UPI002246A492|nr:hypothetical protein [Aquimarina sp. ERC-38]UZO79823.1 hypothetical protein NBT05_12775 [Aquimarina sp. ERC-38]